MVTWNDKKLCDGGFYINLDSREDRRISCENELNKCGIKGVERFSAIKIEDETFSKFGCTESHIQIAKKQIENNWEYALYIEDDIETCLYYDMETKQDSVDILQLTNEIVDNLHEHKPDVLWLGVRLEGMAEPLSNVFIKPKKTLMSHAYIASLKFAHFLVDYLDYKKLSYFAYKWPIDFFISQTGIKTDWTIEAYESNNFINNDIKILATIPLIFSQKPSYSDLTDSYTDYDLWVKQSFTYYANYKKLNVKPILWK